MVCHGITLCAANGHGLDCTVVHTINEIALDERINTLFPIGRGNGRLGRRTFARCAACRTRAIGIGRVTAEHDPEWSGNIATKFARLAATAPATRAPWTAKRAVARWYGADAIIAIRLRGVAFLPARTAIVDIVIEIRARLATTDEITESAGSSSHSARAIGTAVSAHATRRRGRTGIA